jgi:Flp pilus assembly protein TadD
MQYTGNPITIAIAALATLATTGCSLFDGPSQLERHQRRMAAQRAHTEPPDPHPGPSWRDKVRLGDRNTEKGDREAAFVAYLEAVRLAPREPIPRLRIAHQHLDEDPRQAASVFRDVIQEHPDFAPAHAGLGLALLAQNQLDEASQALERAVELDPRTPSARGALAVSYELLGRTEEAERAAAEAWQEEPEGAYWANNLGVLQLARGDWSAAEVSFQAAIELDPQDPAPRNNLGLALGRQERYAEARQAFMSAGDAQAAANNLGYVYLLNGHATEAIAHFERALQAKGNDRRTVLRNLSTALDVLERGGTR